MIKLKLKDGSVREIEKAMPASEIIKDIGMGLYKAACCVKLDGEVFHCLLLLPFLISCIIIYF